MGCYLIVIVFKGMVSSLLKMEIGAVQFEFTMSCHLRCHVVTI